MWGVIAAAWWLFVLPGDSMWWQWVTGAAWTCLAIGYFTSWRLWRPEWDEH